MIIARSKVYAFGDRRLRNHEIRLGRHRRFAVAVIRFIPHAVDPSPTLYI